MCKLLILGLVDTVAVGFSSDNLYSGPNCLLGALISGDGLADSDILDVLQEYISVKFEMVCEVYERMKRSTLY